MYEFRIQIAHNRNRSAWNKEKKGRNKILKQPSPSLVSVGFCDVFMLTKDENKMSQNNDEGSIATSIL